MVCESYLRSQHGVRGFEVGETHSQELDLHEDDLQIQTSHVCVIIMQACLLYIHLVEEITQYATPCTNNFCTNKYMQFLCCVYK